MNEDLFPKCIYPFLAKGFDFEDFEAKAGVRLGLTRPNQQGLVRSEIGQLTKV